MLADALLREELCLGSVRCRGSRDAPGDRRRLEAILGSIASDGLGLPKSALLFTRRLAPALPLGRGAAARRFADAVKSDLAGKLRGARRPWLHADAATADSVLFLDDFELAACLLRDWLGNRALERWWWRFVLGHLSVGEWLRRRVYSHGEILAVTVERLAPAEAVAWFQRMDAGDGARAWGALREAYGVCTWKEADPAPLRDERLLATADAGAAEIPADARVAFQGLVRAVPELMSFELPAEQRALLATALLVRRDLHWARSPSLALAFHAIAHREPISRKFPAPPRDADLDRQQPGSRPPAAEFQTAPEPAAEGAAPRIPDVRDISATPGASVAPKAPMPIEPAMEWPPSMRQEQPRAGLQSESPRAYQDVRFENEVPMACQLLELPAALEATPNEVTGSGPEVTADAQLPPPRLAENLFDRIPVATHFGGVFYLLNVALALGLYGDFTMPRYKGIDLSPWDWLAAIGRRWFGNEFRKDPVWKLLAQLAGHPPRLRPERGFQPPDNQDRQRWFQEQLTYLDTRIGQAIGADDPAQVKDRVCRHRAHIYMSASAVDVHLSLDELPIELRAAGLDRDPGWIPAAGRSVRFHFE